MKTKSIATHCLALLIAATASTAFAAEKDTLNAADSKFVKTVGESGMAEAKVATLGAQKAERADVKEFANMLVTDHGKVNAELAELAKTKGIDVSAVVSADAADKFKALEQESGKDFDKAFLNHMEKCHEKSIAAFEEAEKDSANADVKAWASKTLPTLRAHLAKVKELAAK